jgi:outer membrane protein, heavy metal efflux system
MILPQMLLSIAQEPRVVPGAGGRPARLSALIVTSLMVVAGPGAAQLNGTSLTAEEAVRLALEHSPVVTAARSRLEASTAGARGAQAPFNMLAELAPGVGFTNGNPLLSQQIDIGGQRPAQARAAVGLRSAAQAELDLARLQVAAGARAAYFDLVRARAVETAALDAAALARRIQDAVRRRVEIGEAPMVQLTRAEIEVARVEQDVARAQGDTRGRLTTLNLLLGRPAEAPLGPSDALAIPETPAGTAKLVEQAQRYRPELAVMRGLVEARRGDLAIARAQRRPQLFAELASDNWSLDRDPLNSRNLGFQARLIFPLFDRGRLQAGVERAEAGVREQEAELIASRRALDIEVQRAAAELAAAREVALNYQNTILPRAQDLLRATQAGFDIGLTSFLEVLEAQRLARQTQTEYLNALFDATRARIALERALGIVPGLPTISISTDRSSRR